MPATDTPKHQIALKMAEIVKLDYPNMMFLEGLFPEIPSKYPEIMEIIILREQWVRGETGNINKNYLGHLNLYVYGRDVIAFVDQIATAETYLRMADIVETVLRRFDAPPYDSMQNHTFPNNTGKIIQITFGDDIEFGLAERGDNLWNRARIPFAVRTKEVRT